MVEGSKRSKSKTKPEDLHRKAVDAVQHLSERLATFQFSKNAEGVSQDSEKLAAISDRAEKLKRFKSADALRKFLSNHSERERLLSKISQTVSHRQLAIQRITSTTADLPQNDQVAQYIALVAAGYVEPSRIFRDVPPPASICELSKLVPVVQKLGNLDRKTVQAFTDQWIAALDSFEARWELLTGMVSGIKDGAPPFVRALENKKAPVPSAPVWTTALGDREWGWSGSEHESGRGISRPPFQAKPPPAQPGAPASTSGTDNTEAGPTVHRSTAAAPTDDVSADPADGTADPVDRSCKVEEILTRAGAKPLSSPSTGDARYTFPGPLGMGEEIHYDYLVVIPVDECGPLKADVDKQHRRSLLAAKVAIGQASSIINRLKELGLERSLGSYPENDDDGQHSGYRDIVSDMEIILEEVLALEETAADPADVRDVRRSLRELASMLRASTRRDLFLSNVIGANPADYEPALTAALGSLPPISQIKKGLPSNEPILEPDAPGMTLQIELPAGTLHTAPEGSIISIVPLMISGSWWGYDQKSQVEQLGPYLELIGTTLYERVEALRAAAASMNEAVKSFSGDTAANFVESHKQFVTSELVRMREALAQLLGEIADVLPLAREEPKEGNKRLALGLIYRQTWIPEGYVRGKLVGHKNLPPDGEEKITRRSFVKSSSEVTSAEEFAASRKADLSETAKETSEVLREMTAQFKITASVGGSASFKMVGANASLSNSTDLAMKNRATRTRLAETVMKSSQTYNEKREVKLADKLESEEEAELASTIRNANKEITANYFYYQLVRQYLVTLELHDMRPLLLRTKEVPSEGAIDDKFLSEYAHVLIHVLPVQLASDLAETVNDIEPLGRTMVHRKEEARQRRASYEVFLETPRPVNTDEQPAIADEWDAKLANLEQTMAEANGAAIESEENFLRSRSRLDRVVTHVRANRCHYMEHIWHSQPSADEEKMLQDELYNGYPLPEITNGLLLEGYFGQEAMYSFDGPSVSIAELLIDNLVAGSDIVTSMSEDDLRRTSLFQQLARFYADEEIDDIVESIREQAFVRDPVEDDKVLSNRRVQIAQDALVVETMPGSIPLLEGYQMAQRFLAIERSCLHNEHLRGRIDDRTWADGEDSMRIYRREGHPFPSQEDEP